LSQNLKITDQTESTTYILTLTAIFGK